MLVRKNFCEAMKTFDLFNFEISVKQRRQDKQDKLQKGKGKMNRAL